MSEDAQPAQGLNIYQRRNLAKRTVYGVTFTKVKGQGLKYAYLPIDQVKPVVEKAWNDAGIVVDEVETVITDIREPWDQVSQFGDKSRWYHKQMELTIAMVNMDNPADRVTMTFIGEAKDNSDKVSSKAYTAAIKNFYKLEYNVSDSPKDDADALQTDQAIEESNMTEAELNAAKAKQRAEIMAQAQADPFYGNGKKAVKEAIGPDVEFMDGEALAEAAKVRRDSVNVKDAKIAIAKVRNKNRDNEVVSGYIEKLGPMIGDWQDAQVIDCYLDLLDSGVVQ